MKIQVETEIQSSLSSAWTAWTKSELLTEWFSPEANIDPRVGGPFELFFDPANHEHQSTIGCVFINIEENELIEFTWKGPNQFAALMNDTSSLTTVKVEFSGDEKKTLLKLQHEGWKSSNAWNEARNWHEEQWNLVLDELKKFLQS
ncbi:MAG: SRPBCC family protein [Candidatus Hodarchaeales archaeon]|jgi:uncharacterized protein YndB with AHSA1/START domain